MHVPAECNCLLSDKPTVPVSINNGSCVVLLLEKLGPVVLWYCHVGGGADDAGGGWARHEYDIGTQILYSDETLHEKLVITPVASCCGKFYFSTDFEELGVIEFRRRRRSAPSPCASVYRMDFSKQEWRRVYDLGGQAFLISSFNFGASRPAGECGLEEDCVYVAYPWDKGLMIYNIKEGTMKVENL
ncbi:hypothetical protein BAE44_0006491 [Dichanthelium oligosanthes]|uniref:KIB1-4 beta-propeller domain-containing protein n=1 Tax=Dichanthelium oligosanthes TaxID=888268 RepID=A0A1E5W5D0_9POAL|nr:hypothetical protein BAE44_0006491 [Dichanthelium oligosanthes]